MLFVRASTFIYRAGTIGAMAAYLIGMILVILLVVIFTYIFFWNLVSLVLNLAAIYLVCMRAYFMWQKKQVNHYVIGGAVSLVIVVIFGTISPLWKVTSFLVIAAVIAETLYWYPSIQKPRRKRRRKGVK